MFFISLVFSEFLFVMSVCALNLEVFERRNPTRENRYIYLVFDFYLHISSSQKVKKRIDILKQLVCKIEMHIFEKKKSAF